MEFKWNNDRLLAIDDDDEKDKLTQLPVHVQDKLMTNYLFAEFLNIFTDFFKVSKGKAMLGANKIRSFYTWNDEIYRDFMINLLLNLEPYMENKNVQIIKELEEFSQIIFIQKGKVAVGFEINRQKSYCLMFKDKCIIGAYGLTWNQRAAFNYTSFTFVSGFFIRKKNWEDIL